MTDGKVKAVKDEYYCRGCTSPVSEGANSCDRCGSTDIGKLPMSLGELIDTSAALKETGMHCIA